MCSSDLQNCINYSEKLLNVSNSTIVFDLIKKTRETKEAKSDYIEEKAVVEE